MSSFYTFSNKCSQTSNGNIKETENQQREIEEQLEEIETQSQKTPTPSVKSTTYSQKSTASAQSSNGSKSLQHDTPENLPTVDKEDRNSVTNDEDIVTTPLTTVEATVVEPAEISEVTCESPSKWKTGEDILQVEDVVDGENQIQNIYEEIQEKNTKLERNGSLASLQSKSESIKTQLEDTPTALSRTQSAKSLVIEEDIEDNTSFVVVEEVEQTESVNKQQNEITEDTETQDEEYPKAIIPGSGKSRTALSRIQSPTIEEIKALSRRNSMIKSMESLYERPPSKHDYTDNTTETSSQSSAQFNSSTGSTSIPIKALRTPLKQKSKTTHFLKSHRRVSPVKQSIKMQQAELYPASLQRFEKPREAILKTFDQLDSANWEVIMLGLKSLVRLMRYHPENLDPQMHMICIQLTKSVRNLRSQVARAACTAATEIFTIKSRYLEQECDDLVHALLHRTADTNRFIRADATRALESMCDNLTPQKILNILTTKGAQHPHALVRTTTAKLLNRLVERLSCDKIYTMPRDQRDKFFVTGANLLLEGSLETRSYAKTLFKLLSDHPNYQRLLLEVIPTRTYRNIEKTLKSIC